MTDKSKGKKQEIRSSEKLQTKSGFSVKGKMKTILPDEEVKKSLQTASMKHSKSSK